ncbi:MAG: hypothetical protein N4A35_05540 [Flavobacteriales bacterium]|jgi:hypothetical protein|nr:hypothetical protein [Flavobacteriales bacterium]
MRQVVIVILISLSTTSFAQSKAYTSAFEQLKSMLEDKQEYSFKKAVFLVENAYLDNTIIEKEYNNVITQIAQLATVWSEANKLENYPYEDSLSFAMNRAIFTLMTDTIFITKGIPLHYPFTYDFEDFFGEKDWSNQFVIKLINEHTGNCHSMPYLYKILAEELGTKAYLSFAPNHIYIKQRSKKPDVGFYNTELTSKCFPVDAWIMTSGYVSMEAIMNNLYMDTLGDKESIAINLIDLAEGHKRKEEANLDFVLQCCDLALEYYPNYANGLLLKAETLKRQFEEMMKLFNAIYPSELFTNSEAVKLYQEMETTYGTLIEKGYRNVPQTVYLKWLEELANNLDKYSNKKISTVKNN